MKLNVNGASASTVYSVRLYSVISFFFKIEFVVENLSLILMIAINFRILPFFVLIKI